MISYLPHRQRNRGDSGGSWVISYLPHRQRNRGDSEGFPPYFKSCGGHFPIEIILTVHVRLILMPFSPSSGLETSVHNPSSFWGQPYSYLRCTCSDSS